MSCISRLDYPADKLQIQVLDDSTDDTALLVSRLVAQYKAKGKNFELIHRTDRRGFKAGALTEGLKTATGDLVGIFDADFAPRSRLAAAHGAGIQRPQAGMFADPLGAPESSLQCFHGSPIPGHRWALYRRADRPFPQWLVPELQRHGRFVAKGSHRRCRRLAIGYAHRGPRLELPGADAGWRIGYLPDVVVPAELPAQVEAFKKQQFRWAKGSFQTVKKLVPEMFKEDMPWWRRLMGLIHITGYFVHPLMLMALVLILPIGLFAPSFLKFFSLSCIASFGPPLMYILARCRLHPTCGTASGCCRS